VGSPTSAIPSQRRSVNHGATVRDRPASSKLLNWHEKCCGRGRFAYIGGAIIHRLSTDFSCSCQQHGVCFGWGRTGPGGHCRPPPGICVTRCCLASFGEGPGAATSRAPGHFLSRLIPPVLPKTKSPARRLPGPIAAAGYPGRCSRIRRSRKVILTTPRPLSANSFADWRASSQMGGLRLAIFVTRGATPDGYFAYRRAMLNIFLCLRFQYFKRCYQSMQPA
jgi:hypothetical protein